MKKTMTAKMEEGFKSEQQARQLDRSEIMKGLKDEESARQMVQKDLEVLKEEMKACRCEAEAHCAAHWKGLGGSGTFARRPAFASRFSEVFIPRIEGILGDIRRRQTLSQ